MSKKYLFLLVFGCSKEHFGLEMKSVEIYSINVSIFTVIRVIFSFWKLFSTFLTLKITVKDIEKCHPLKTSESWILNFLPLTFGNYPNLSYSPRALRPELQLLQRAKVKTNVNFGSRSRCRKLFDRYNSLIFPRSPGLQSLNSARGQN